MESLAITKAPTKDEAASVGCRTGGEVMVMRCAEEPVGLRCPEKNEPQPLEQPGFDAG